MTRQYHENFAKIAENEPDPYFKTWFEDARDGKFPKKFTYYNNELTFTKKRNQVYRVKFLFNNEESIKKLKDFIRLHAGVQTSCKKKIKIIKTEAQINKEVKSLFKTNHTFRKQLLRNYFTSRVQNVQQVVLWINALFLNDEITVDNFQFKGYRIYEIVNIEIEHASQLRVTVKKKLKSDNLFGGYTEWRYHKKKSRNDFDSQFKKLFGASGKKDALTRASLTPTTTNMSGITNFS